MGNAASPRACGGIWQCGEDEAMKTNNKYDETGITSISDMHPAEDEQKNGRYWNGLADSFLMRPMTRKLLPGSQQWILSDLLIKSFKEEAKTGPTMKSIRLPPNASREDWIAVNTTQQHQLCGLIWRFCSKYCTEISCPKMTAGKCTYLWRDGVKYKKAVEVSAPAYVEKLLEWVKDQLQNKAIFPTSDGATYPVKYDDKVKDIWKRLFRLYAHMYRLHFSQIQTEGLSTHVNVCFKYFILFGLEFKLVETKDMGPMKSYMNKILEVMPKNVNQNGTNGKR